MKYSQTNLPLVCMQTNSTCYKGTRTMDVKGVLWHSTGANNPYLKRYVQPGDKDANRAEMLKILGVNQYGNDWNHVSRQAGLNCWIGKLADGTVATVQTMPWNYRPWGCGSGKNGTCNTGWVQFEICEDALTDKSYFDKVYKEACEITAYICKYCGVDPLGSVKVNGVTVPTILCHWDSYKLGMGCGHSDVYPWFNRYGKTMDDVRRDVVAIMNQQTLADALQTGYHVRVTAADGLNCRSTWSVAGTILKTYPKGTVLYITREINGWGETGGGWVNLSYTERIEAEPKEEAINVNINMDELKELIRKTVLEVSETTINAAVVTAMVGLVNQAIDKAVPPVVEETVGAAVLTAMNAAMDKLSNEVYLMCHPVYDTLDDVPEWYKPTVRKLMDAGALKGTGQIGEIDVSEDFCRVMTVLDRMGHV